MGSAPYLERLNDIAISFITVSNKSSQSYGKSLAVRDHTVIYLQPNASEHAQPNPSKRGPYFINLPQTDGRLSWPRCWVYTEMVYLIST